MKIDLIYIGDHFYRQSGTMMSPIYKDEGNGKFSRYDWGFVQVALGDGHEINIRQATDAEFGKFCRELEQRKKKSRYCRKSA